MVSHPCFLVLLSTIAWLTLTAQGVAHPFHVSIAEAEWNQETAKLEVALRLKPMDLEQAVRQVSGERIRLEDSKRCDPLIERYLRERIRIDVQGKPAPLTWVGKEVSVKEAWVYFEIKLPDGPEGLRFTNQLLFDVQKDQVNTVNLRWKSHRKSLRFTREKPTVLVTPPQPAKKGTAKAS